jgi:hypothetical protein
MDFEAREEQTEARRDGRIEEREQKTPTRWVQLAYDLEQYGEESSEQRGEVF